MPSSKLLLLTLCCASAGLTACVADDERHDGDLLRDDIQVDDVEKADHLSLNFREFDAPVDTDRLVKGGVAIVTSASSYEEYFGQAAPLDIDFDHEWVGFFGIGVRNTGGYSASITSLEVLPWWYGGMVMRAVDSSPGSDCLVTQAFTNPYSLVRFDKPQTDVSWFSLDQESVVTKCGPDNDDRLAELADSREVWEDARDANSNSYTYTTEFQSFTGFGGRTTIVVENGAVVERHYKAQHISGGTATVWSEFGADVGSHAEGAAPRLVDELYAICENDVLAHDEESNWMSFVVDSTDGILRACQYTPKQCYDDCSRGVTIASIEF